MSVPERVSRYVVLRELGAGAMGMVVVAYDPELDRQLAIKLIHPRVASHHDAHARMLREAKGLARLSHPNVVQVYDTGTLAGRVFIAMELVDGEPLSQWRVARERTFAEILAVHLGAGKGLAAAHDAGLVHRDFKPDNVLVDREGRARVLDFGLVRAVGEGEANPEASLGVEPTVEVSLASGLGDLADLAGVQAQGTAIVGLQQTHAATPQPRTRESSGAFGGQSSSELEIELTHGGQLMGTPAYMSPEQWRGTKADARSDQFSFCVSLWEALYGQRPFAGRTIQALARAACSGEIIQAHSALRIPRRVQAALERGLRVDPEQRFASMDALLVELSRQDWNRRSLPLAALALGAFGLLAWGSDRGREVETPPSCAQAGDAVGEVWNLERNASITASFAATGVPSDAVVAQLNSNLDDYARGWRAAAEDNCAATTIREQQSAELLDLRTQCLAVKLDALDALLDVFGDADEGIVNEALLAVESLPSLLACEPERVRSSTAALPNDPQLATLVQETRRALAGARAHLDMGRFNEAAERLEGITDAVEGVDYAPLQAEFDVEQGRSFARLDQHEKAAEALQRGYFQATRLHDDELALRASTWLAELEGAQRRRPEFAKIWAGHAQALLDRDAARYPDVAADLADTVSWNAYLAGDLSLARAEAERGLAVLDDAQLSAPMHRMALLLDRGAAEYGDGDLVAAEASFLAALELAETTLGRDNAKATGALNNLAVVYSAEGEYARARTLLQESVSTRERALGPDNISVGIGLSNLADIELELGNGQAALEATQRAHAILLASVGSDQYATVIARQRLGLARAMVGDHQGALVDLREALAVALTPPADGSLAFELQAEILVVLAAAKDVEASAAALEQVRVEAPGRWRELVVAGRYAARVGEVSMAVALLELGIQHAGESDDAGSRRILATAKLALAELMLVGPDADTGRARTLLGPELDSDLEGAPKLLAALADLRVRAVR